MDELAHTNAPGSRHPKRYQDVQEILAAGIDVYTTLNIQHLESLNDVVAQVTGVVVRETVPGRVIDDASEIEVIDLPPDELLIRLQEGKVYVPEQAARALQKFFRKGNLTALREMSLRRAAERVDDQMRAYMQNQAWQGLDAANNITSVLVTQKAFSSVIPFGSAVVAFASFLFGYTTLIGWSYYGEKCIEYIGGNKVIMPYRYTFIIFLFVGAILTRILVARNSRHIPDLCKNDGQGFPSG